MRARKPKLVVTPRPKRLARIVAAGKVRLARRQPESQLQASITQLLDIYERQGRLAWWPVPNGLYIPKDDRDRARKIAALKRRGQLRPGVSDIGVCMRGGMYGCMEVKWDDNVPTDSQEQFQVLIRRMGGFTAVVYSVDDVRRAIDAWERRLPEPV